MFQRILVFLALTAVVLSQCPASNELSDLYSNTVTINSNALSIAQRQFSFTLQSAMKSNPFLALGITDVSFPNGKSTSFSISASSFNTTTVTFLVKNIDASLSRLRIIFWICARADIQVGNLPIEFENPSRGQSVIKRFNLRQALPSLTGQIVRVFLNGFNGDSTSALNLKLAASIATVSVVELTVTIASDVLCKALYISYVTFSPSAAVFDSIGRLVTRNNLMGLSFEDVYGTTGAVYTSPYLLIGIVSIAVNPKETIFASGISENLIVSMNSVSSLSSVSISFIAVAQSSLQACTSCPGKIIDMDSCVSSCPAETYKSALKTSVEVCRSCSQLLNKVLNSDKTGCVCALGYTLVDSYCVKSSSSTPTSPTTPSNSTPTQPSSPATPTSSSSPTSGSQSPVTNYPGMPSDKVLQAALDDTLINVISVSGQNTINILYNQTFNIYINNATIDQSTNILYFGHRFIPEQGGNQPSSPGQSNNPSYPNLNPLPNGQGATFRPLPLIPGPSVPIVPIVPQTVDPATGVVRLPDGSIYNPNPVTPPPPPPTQTAPNTIDTPAPAKSPSVPINDVNTPIAPIGTSASCTAASNTYWTGYRCACRVGYTNSSNICIPATSYLFTNPWSPFGWSIGGNMNPPPGPVCRGPNEVQSGSVCVCVTGYVRSSGVCTKIVTPVDPNPNPTPDVCPPGSTGVYIVNIWACISLNVNCPANSYPNGLGYCICQNGYLRPSDNTCVVAAPCPDNYARDLATGKCFCLNGPTLAEGACSKCPENNIFNLKDKTCIPNCKANSIYNAATKSCTCIPGFGYFQGLCQLCPSYTFLVNGFCVICPIRSSYDYNSRTCQCNEDYRLGSDGICVSKCTNNEIFNPLNGKCVCPEGLGRITPTDKCAVCPTNFVPNSNDICTTCPVNEVFLNNACSCPMPFIRNNQKTCISCNTLPGHFVLEGRCARCPSNQVFDATSGKCQCLRGFKLVSITCERACRIDEGLDNDGNCFICPSNSYLQNGACVCIQGYQLTDGYCKITCSADSFPYKGKCAKCPSGTVYRPQIGGCACPLGSYISVYGNCETLAISSITCPAGQFLDQTLGCTACSSTCTECTSLNSCTKCPVLGFSPNRDGLCLPVCGNFIVSAGEQCDDGNNRDGDGCSSTCIIEPLFTCTGSPSVCTASRSPSTPAVCGNRLLELGEGCDDGNIINGDGCSAVCQVETGFLCSGNPSVCRLDPIGSNNQNNLQCDLKVTRVLNNQNGIFVLLEVNNKFPEVDTIPEENGLITVQATTPPGTTTNPPSATCSRTIGDLKMLKWSCLLTYTTVPSSIITLRFQINRPDCKIVVAYNYTPTATNSMLRSIRT